MTLYTVAVTPAACEKYKPTTCLHMHLKAHLACIILTVFSKMKNMPRSQPFAYTENVVIRRKPCNTGSLLLQSTNRKSYMAYRIAATPMTLSDLRGDSPTSRLFKRNVSYSSAAVNSSSSVTARRAAPLR